MKIVIFGLTISSSWGNGHATLWRGLCKHLMRLGHTVVFYERDVPYYAGARDFDELPGGALRLFSSWEETRSLARSDVGDADVAIVTSYCPDAIAATEMIVSEGRAVPVFYDLDTPVTLARLMANETVPYVGPRGLQDFALVLSFTGGPRVTREFHDRLGARDIRPLYGHVDSDIHRPVPPQPHYRADLSYLGTYSEDRQRGLEALFVEPARARQDLRFLIAGAQYPDDFPWSSNIYFVRHLPPSEHAPFFASSRLTLNVTRKAMADMGWCPSGRLFEAAACGVPLLSDDWPGIEEFFAPGREILIARDAEDTLAALAMSNVELQSVARSAYERTMDQHTSDKRACELVSLLEQAASSGAHRPQSAEA
ncbi:MULTISPECIES: CgeB family protein [unclassified Bradyrhizobium]|uniref:CgeB family protein n=1 Tax=unclassified Bradyrhizobium TaxID=2631580 RepID=UPI000745E025|nr:MULTISPECIES: glycosyltransferase [unclassified Bradyrhizobium]AMA57475.1 glycosyltransferase [Bradyrhizobium sp. CCGE-LA001]KYH00320.1 glycosyltransferase [Bradyrhizobium sp. DOA1]